ncbi:hypothetical protein BOTBODRAFT_60680 [Botryobasidium botryosum FD-172 SS1]|uniref:Protein kinase domain-containing protein n=1 Tax=Botryobasidium botryosum (strain FD-172 SS1) TaxID=930990 RepID=A0A067LT82_BOTB1|nr:hypothetical protein BOTBODRAFT_60680 [Botryobasidium botryosum FD-172 SS1]
MHSRPSSTCGHTRYYPGYTVTPPLVLSQIPTSSERAWGREFSIAKGQDADTLSDELRANETPDTYNIAFSKLADKILDELQILLRHQPLGFDCSLLSARILDTLQPNASTLSTDKTSGVEIEHGLPIESAEQPPAASNESKLDLPNQRDKVTTLPEMEAPTSPQFSLASELLKSLARKHEHTFFPFYGKQLELLRICGHKSLRALQENSDLGDQSRESSLTALISILQSVESRTDYIADLDSFECLIHQPTIEANLETELSSLQALELVTQTRAHEWSEDLAATRKNDRDFIVDMIRSQPEMESLDPARRKLLDERLKELQEKLKSNTAGPGSLDLDDRRMELFALHSLFDVTLPHAELRLGVEYTDETQVSSDKNWDVWEATWLGQQKVMLSVRRGSYRVLGKKDRQLVRREVYIRRQLHSSYILPLYGICSEPERPPFRVSPWCKNGTAVDYLREKPTGQAFKICLEAAYGLRYLHSFDKPIVLGGMKGETIYISDQGSALLAGFELSDHEGGTFDSSMVSRGQWAPWIAPELVASSLKGTKAQLTRPCDIWTWAVATLELMSKQSISDFDDSADQAAIVEHGQHLDLDKFKLPSESESELRPLLEECWQLKPEMRLDITQVVMRMEVAWRIFSLFDR